MTREEMLAKREELLGAAESVKEDAKAYRKALNAIEKFDADWDSECKALAEQEMLNKTENVNPAIIEAANLIEKMEDKSMENNEMLYNTAWLKTLMNKELTNEEAESWKMMNLDTSTGAGVIPTTMMQNIWSVIADQHPIVADSFPGRTYVSGKVEIPVAGDSADASWLTEATATTPSSTFTTAKVTLTGYDLSKAVTVSWKMKEMALADFERFLTNLLAEKLGNAIATAIVAGTGSGQPTGIKTAIAAESSTPQLITYASSIAYSDITSAMAVIKAGYKPGAAIYASSAVIWGSLANILDSNNRPLFIQDCAAGSVGRIFGLPVKEEASVPAGEVLIGNVGAGYASNVNKDVSIITEDHALARTTDYVGYMVYDGNVKTTKAFAYIDAQ